MKNTDHQLTKADAALLEGAVLLPMEFRIQTLRKLVLQERGSEGLLLLFANFLGLVNQLGENAEQFARSYLIEKCGHAPEIAAMFNPPTIHGALIGIRNAVPDATPKMCPECAYRQGTVPNQCAVTAIHAEMAAAGEWAFSCHLEMDAAGEPTKACGGYAAAVKAGK